MESVEARFMLMREQFIFYCREERKLQADLQRLFPLHMECERARADGENIPFSMYIARVERGGESHWKYLQLKRKLEECVERVWYYNDEIAFIVKLFCN